MAQYNVCTHFDSSNHGQVMATTKHVYCVTFVVNIILRYYFFVKYIKALQNSVIKKSHVLIITITIIYFQFFTGKTPISATEPESHQR